MADKPNFLVRVFGGLWRLIDGTRRLVVNLLFLLVLFLVLAVVLRDAGITIPERSALVLDPSGMIVEQYSVDPTERALAQLFDDETPETRLRDLLDAIELATHDARIERIVIQTDYLWGIGLAKLQELKAALEAFKGAGKSVFAYSHGMDQQQYYLASLADEVWLHPEGIVFLEGYSVYRNFYREGLDKLSVDVHLFRVGEYKSAAEPFVRDDMSEYSKEANRYWLSGLWGDYLGDVAANRGLSPQELNDHIERFGDHLREAGGSAAQAALAAGLVDRLATLDELRELMIELGARDGDTFRQVGFMTYLAANRPVPNPVQKKVAVVVAQGVILGGDQPSGTIGGESTARLLREARNDERVAAVVLRVDSPGGAVLPSEQIRREVELTRAAGKPVVVSMSSVAASGGYWIAMSADEIWASPGTITGSIGIYGLLTNFPRTLEKIGIHTDGVGTTPMAGTLRADRPLPEHVGDIIQQIIDEGYERFISKVAASRDLDPDQVDRIARGRVWSGSQALERGLVDHLGGLSQAVASAAGRGGVSDYRVVYAEEQPSRLEQLLLDLTATLPRVNVASRFSWLSRLLEGQTGTDLELLLGQPRNERVGVYAYCFCGL